MTGEITFIGATAIAEYISPTPVIPAAPPATLHSNVETETGPGNSGSSAIMTSAPAG